MRQISIIQADIKAHHDVAKEKAVPVHFLHLINLQNEFNAALLVELSKLQEAASTAGGADVAAFMAKVNEALFKDTDTGNPETGGNAPAIDPASTGQVV